METLTLIFAIVGTIALLFGAGMATWRTNMLLRWQRRRATVVSYRRQPAYRGSSFVKLTVRFTDNGEPVEGTGEC